MPFLAEDGEQAWKVASSGGNEREHVDEWLRPGQTVENWTELVTVQALNKAVGLSTVEDQLELERSDLMARCPGSTLEIISSNPKIVYEAKARNCETGPDEHVLGRVLDGQWNRFVVLYTVRGEETLTPQRRREWIQSLSEVFFVDIPDQPPLYTGTK